MKHKVLIVAFSSLLIAGCSAFDNNKSKNSPEYDKLNGSSISFDNKLNENGFFKKNISRYETVKLTFNYILDKETFDKNFNIKSEIGTDIKFSSKLFYDKKNEITYVFVSPENNSYLNLFKENKNNWGHLSFITMNSKLDFEKNVPISKSIKFNIKENKASNKTEQIISVNNNGFLEVKSNFIFNVYSFEENKLNEVSKDNESNYIFNSVKELKLKDSINNFNSDFYFVTTLDEKTKELIIVKTININEYKKLLPNKINDIAKLEKNTLNSNSEIPKSVNINFLNDSVLEKELTFKEPYEFSKSGINYLKYDYSINNTPFSGYFLIKVESKVSNNNSNSSNISNSNNNVKQNNNISKNNTSSNTTSNETGTKSKSNNTIKKPEKTYVKDNIEFAEVSDKIINEINNVSKNNNILKNEVDVIVKEPSKAKTVTAPTEAPVIDKEYTISYDNEFERYLANNLIAQTTAFSIANFDQSKNINTIKDTVKKVILQNPLVMNVDSYAIYSNGVLEFNYKNTNLTTKQKAIMSEANKVIRNIIRPGMTDEQKVYAIYNYLEENTRYDYGAAENAAKNNYKSINSSFDDSFNTYGIMVNKVGVCQSYSGAFNLLADLAGVESIVVTGDMKGVPHSWNKVKINGVWYNVDSTNNLTNSNVPYMAFLMNDDNLKKAGYIFDNDYWTDSDIGKFNSTNNSLEYYQKNNLIANSYEDYTKIMEREFKKGNKTISIRFFNNNLTSDQLGALVIAAAHKSNVKLSGMTYSLGNTYISFTIY